MTDLGEIRKKAASSGFFFEAVHDRTGVHGISISFENDDGSLDHHFVVNDDDGMFDDFLEDVFSHRHMKVCFDMRHVMMLGLKLNVYCDVIDLSIVFNNTNLFSTVNRHITLDIVDDFHSNRKKYESHITAATEAKIDLNVHSELRFVPGKLMVNFYRLKLAMLRELYSVADDAELELFENLKYRHARALYMMEKNGVRVDIDIEYDTTNIADVRFMRALASQSHGSYVKMSVVPERSITGRSASSKGFVNFMGIPRSIVRSSIISRFDGGSIAVIDYNAADYRCIVSATGNKKLISLYDGYDDFHDRTAELLFEKTVDNPDVRNVVKNVTYMYIYGGSIDKISRNVGLSVDLIETVIKKLDTFMEPVTTFRNELCDKSYAEGRIVMPNGRTIMLGGDEHRGKVLAYYAQTLCNDAFMAAVADVCDFLDDMSSCCLFTVHDELVVDLHPDELGVLDEIIEKMEVGSYATVGTRLKTKTKIGKNYWELDGWKRRRTNVS